MEEHKRIQFDRRMENSEWKLNVRLKINCLFVFAFIYLTTIMKRFLNLPLREKLFHQRQTI